MPVWEKSIHIRPIGVDLNMNVNEGLLDLFEDTAEDVGADDESIASIVIPAERRAQHELDRILRIRKAGSVWCNFTDAIRDAWSDHAGRLNDISLSRFLLDIPRVFTTLGIEYNLKF